MTDKNYNRIRTVGYLHNTDRAFKYTDITLSKLRYAKPGTKSRSRVDISPSYLGGYVFGYRPDTGFANLEFSKFFQSFPTSAMADLK